LTDTTPKKYLQRLRLLDICIKQKEAELEALRAASESVSPVSDGERVQTSPRDRTIEDVARIVDLESEINKDIGQFLVTRNKIINEIQGLDNPVYMNILFKRYVEYKQLEEIAVEMNYSYRQVLRLHGYALREFGKHFPSYFMRRENRADIKESP